MPTVTLSLKSQRSKPVPDRVRFIEARGRFSGPLHPNAIEIRSSEVVLDLVPDTYTVRVGVEGFHDAAAPLSRAVVAQRPFAQDFALRNRVETLPKVSELGAEQRRLLETLDDTKTPGEIWHALTDNKAATFFQITYALSQVALADGAMLSSVVDHVVRVGGSDLTAPDKSGKSRTVTGWRLHVVFTRSLKKVDIEGAGFKQDEGFVHPTHTRFDFVRSFRERRRGHPKLQIVTNYEGTGADVDLDTGAFHKSSPHQVFKSFAKRFPGAAEIYEVT